MKGYNGDNIREGIIDGQRIVGIIQVSEDGNPCALFAVGQNGTRYALGESDLYDIYLLRRDLEAQGRIEHSRTNILIAA